MTTYLAVLAALSFALNHASRLPSAATEFIRSLLPLVAALQELRSAVLQSRLPSTPDDEAHTDPADSV